MKILVLNGSPHVNGATADMVSAFRKGAEEAGNEVIVIQAAHKNIRGCLACEYCHEKEKGVCVQKDDMQEIYPEILSADMVVFASPIYYFTFSAQLQALIHRTYAIGIPENVKKTALIMSSGDKFVYAAAITEYFQGIVEYWGVENTGIFTANGDENKSEKKRQELYRFGRSLQEEK
ncbi:MAG: flavodoxin family protein [Solobacterium sp.]|nr:flavodoxin family protein [Solobacterium sp.]